MPDPIPIATVFDVHSSELPVCDETLICVMFPKLMARVLSLALGAKSWKTGFPECGILRRSMFFESADQEQLLARYSFAAFYRMLVIRDRWFGFQLECDRYRRIHLDRLSIQLQGGVAPL